MHKKGSYMGGGGEGVGVGEGEWEMHRCVHFRVPVPTWTSTWHR